MKKNSNLKRLEQSKKDSQTLDIPEFSIVKVDITEDGNETLYDRWKYEIPVFYFENKFLCKNRIDMVKLLEKMGPGIES